MKSKKIAITVCTIAVVVLAVFIGTKLMTNSQDDSKVASNGVVESNMDLTGEVTKEKEENKEEKKTVEEDKKTMEEEQKEDDSKLKETNELQDEMDQTTDQTEEMDQTTDKTKESDNLLFEKEEDREDTSAIDENTNNSIEVFSDMYTVKDKETLSQIANKCLERNNLELENALYFNPAIDVIIGINDLENPNLIIAGTKLYMPTVKAFEGILPEGDAYEVKEGDTLFSIVKNEMSWCEDIVKAKKVIMNNNKIENENSIQAGSVIYIPEENNEF